MATGEITLINCKEDTTGMRQILEMLEGILQYQLQHREAIIQFDSQRIPYESVESSTSSNISLFYVIEEECSM